MILSIHISNMTGPDGTIVFGSVTINKADMVYDASSARYYLDLEFTDPNYKQTVNAVGGNTLTFSYNLPAQAQFQIPPYVIKIMKKTTPPQQNNGSNLVQSLYTSFSSFNDQIYKRASFYSSDTFTAPDFGVGLVPYSYFFNGSFSWSYGDISESDDTSGGTISVKCDASGGVVFTGGPSIGSIPLKQRTHGDNINSPVSQSCKAFDISNGFTEPGAYLVIVIRNAIQNEQKDFFPVDLGKSRPSSSAALAIINPPKTDMSYNSVSNRVSFTIIPYGSLLQARENRWTVTNAYYGTQNFATPRYPYDVSINSNGTFPIQYFSFQPEPRYDALAFLEASADRTTLTQVENSPTPFEAVGAYQYDFRIDASFPPVTFVFFPYSASFQSNGYVNYPFSSIKEWDNYMLPAFSQNWSSLLQVNGLTNSDISFYDTRSLVDYSTNPITIPGGNSPIPFNTEITQIGSDYVFHSYWREDFQSLLTPYLVDASYVLRLYHKDPYVDGSVNYTYRQGAVTNFKYESPTNTGLTIFPNWKTTSPTYTMDIYTDKGGNVYYNTPPGAGTFTGWTTSEISGAWLMVLQRNFTTFGSSNLNIALEACYAVDVDDPSLVEIYDGTGTLTGFDTQNIIEYADASNIWTVFEEDTNQTLTLDQLISNPNPSIIQFASAYPERQGPGVVLNRVVNKFNVGSYFNENLGTYGFHIATDISGQEATFYDVCSNTVLIYQPKQSNEEADYLANIQYDFAFYDSSKTFFQLLFTEPDYRNLRKEAYDINIFKKYRGTGTFLSQWYPDGSVGPYKYTDVSNRGVSISQSDVSLAINVPSPPTNRLLINADICGNNEIVPSFLPPWQVLTDPSGSFFTGGYFAVIRRNFYKTPPDYPLAKEPHFTLNSQYIHVPPTQTWKDLKVFGSTIQDISIGVDIASNRFITSTDVFGAYVADGSVPDITLNWFRQFQGFSIPSYSQVESSLVTEELSGGYIDITEAETRWAGLGNLLTYVDYSYNWSAPVDISYELGQIGYGYKTIEPARSSAFNSPGPDNKVLYSNQAVTPIFEYTLPDDISWNAANIVNDLRASFVIPAGTTDRVMSLTWKDPSPFDLCSNWTGFPYAIRLYKKESSGYSPNDQWYSQDNSGIYPYQFKEPNYQGFGVSAEFFSESPTGDTMYLFLDLSGKVFYNEFPTSPAPVVTPFTEGGGYIVVVQRHYTNSDGDFALSTRGHYLNFIPTGPDNPWSLVEEGNFIASNPNPYSSYEPGVEGGDQDLKFAWDISIPERRFKQKIPGQDSSFIDIDVILRAYSGYGTGSLISEVTYDFGIFGDGTTVAAVPFIEHYPVLSILGEPFPVFLSDSLDVDLCLRPSSYPPPPWVRFTNNCSNLGFTSEQLQMRRKAETLKHENSLKEKRMTKAEYYAFVAKGLNNKKKTYATQTDTFTDPNTQNYPTSGSGLTLPQNCPNQVFTFPSSASDVPGPVVPLTFDPNVPLLRYRRVYTYPNPQKPPGPFSDIK